MTQDDVPDEFCSKVNAVIDERFPDGLLAWAESGSRRPKDELHELAIRLLLAMIAVEDSDKIPQKDRWRRRRKALRVAGGRASSWSEMVSLMAEELHATEPRPWTSKALSSIYSRVADDFSRFREICHRDAFMIASDAQVVRDQRFSDDDFEDDDDELDDLFGLESEMDLPSPAENA